MSPVGGEARAGPREPRKKTQRRGWSTLLNGTQKESCGIWQ